MAQQGKCPKCRIRWTWDREIPLQEVKCASCRGPLRRTSHLSAMTRRPSILQRQAI